MKNYTLNLIKLLFLLWLFLASVIQTIWAQKRTGFSIVSVQVYSPLGTSKPKNEPQIIKKTIYNQFEKLIAYQAIVKSAQTLDLWLKVWFATLQKTSANPS